MSTRIAYSVFPIVRIADRQIDTINGFTGPSLKCANIIDISNVERSQHNSLLRKINPIAEPKGGKTKRLPPDELMEFQFEKYEVIFFRRFAIDIGVRFCWLIRLGQADAIRTVPVSGNFHGSPFKKVVLRGAE